MHSSGVYEIYANAGERDARDAERDTDEPGMLLGTGRILFLDSGGGGGGVDGEGVADGEASTVVAILARVLGEIGRRRHAEGLGARLRDGVCSKPVNFSRRDW